MQEKKARKMQYRNFGNSGLKLSVISLGNMINYKPENFQIDQQLIKKCIEAGVNHFDTAELYGAGQAEIALGKMLKNIGVDRQSIVISTKVHTAANSNINTRATTNRKHIKYSIKNSLKNLQMDYVDIIYAHIDDMSTPLQEICRGFNEVIEDGDAFYWATSNWPIQNLFETFAICEKYNLHKPIGSQNEYNLLQRYEVQYEHDLLYKKYGFGLICWSPLAGGFLTGKYLEGVNQKQENRMNDNKVAFSVEVMKAFYFNPYHNEKTINILKEIKKVAEEVDCKLVHLALAWVIKYQYVSSALIGARNQAQLEDCLKALDIIEKITPELQIRINKILGNSPVPRYNYVDLKDFPPAR